MVFFVVYSSLIPDFNLSSSDYRTAGIPSGVQVRSPNLAQSEAFPFIDGVYGNVLKSKNAALFAQIEQAPECIIIQGVVTDPSDLNFLRDCVGVVTYLMDHGGIAVLDVQSMGLYGAADWRRIFFEPQIPNLRAHVSILFSGEETGGRWYHTRGMRKFGRPDLSLRNVPEEYETAVIDLCNRFTGLQAEGGQIPEGQEIRMSSLPEGLICHHKGSMDDFDFNNTHVEIKFPVHNPLL